MLHLLSTCCQILSLICELEYCQRYIKAQNAICGSRLHILTGPAAPRAAASDIITRYPNRPWMPCGPVRLLLGLLIRRLNQI